MKMLMVQMPNEIFAHLLANLRPLNEGQLTEVIRSYNSLHIEQGSTGEEKGVEKPWFGLLQGKEGVLRTFAYAENQPKGTVPNLGSLKEDLQHKKLPSGIVYLREIPEASYSMGFCLSQLQSLLDFRHLRSTQALVATLANVLAFDILTTRMMDLHLKYTGTPELAEGEGINRILLGIDSNCYYACVEV